ncbi:uncharacterized protein E0L32_000292 [Thyridium curvatum]|uniref:Uncharacterized protein n=1 Tax=Thyridium curvatum TaxID=1093900 RepID=A0A507BGV9_9PEZI|nr:uncharacterized protein E0L32_000292 [Thyridium curvatum]TPX15958.1 hypothetical protein E0L32_000292 [Thyridium curvatum]
MDVMSRASDTDKSSNGTLTLTVPQRSTNVALLTLIPTLLVLLALFCWALFNHAKKATNRSQQRQARWKPLSLKYPTLVILLGINVALIILLESATMALPERSVSPRAVARDVHALRDSSHVATSLELMAVRAEMRSSCKPSKCTVDESPDTVIKARSSSTPSPGAPGPGIGWLSRADSGSLSSSTVYFIGTFLPVLAAVLFAIPWKIIELDTKSLEPFAQLSTEEGSTASDTLLLHYDGPKGLFRAVAGAFIGHVAVALSTLLVWVSTLLTPLAAETVGLTLQGDCLHDWKKQCTATLQVATPVVRAMQALLAIMSIALFAYMFIVVRKRSFGLWYDPRSILGIASLSLSSQLTRTIRQIPLKKDGVFSISRAVKTLGQRRFKLGYAASPVGQSEYGITVIGDDDTLEVQEPVLPLRACEKPGDEDTTSYIPEQVEGQQQRSKQTSVGSLMLLKIGAFSAFVVGLMVLILYYRLTYDDTGFEEFMDSQSHFGVRFLFTAFGVVVHSSWSSIFAELATILPVWNMCQHAMDPNQSILMPLSPNPYTGLTMYLAERQKLPALLALSTILGEFLPILLANVPFNNAITWNTFNGCSIASVVILAVMLVVLAVTAVYIFILNRRQRDSPLVLPFKERNMKTLAAVLYLVCRSDAFLGQLQGASIAEKSMLLKAGPYYLADMSATVREGLRSRRRRPSSSDAAQTAPQRVPDASLADATDDENVGTDNDRTQTQRQPSSIGIENDPQEIIKQAERFLTVEANKAHVAYAHKFTQSPHRFGCLSRVGSTKRQAS